MGSDLSTFQLILEGGFEELWNTTSIARSDTNSNGLPRVEQHSQDAARVSGLILHSYLCLSIITVYHIFSLFASFMKTIIVANQLSSRPQFQCEYLKNKQKRVKQRC
jgi:hypothetical protein